MSENQENKQAKQDNLIKKTAKELGMTYKELGEAIGYSEAAIKASIAKGEISEPMKKSIEMYLEITSLKNQNKDFETFKEFFKKILQNQ
ncbi:transcriptional regulator [Helicobacter sp. 11S03491-1]|uniref:transcriptional regulator n=1 Tax=Helicobacter sp. 11S03491-1 TaxID=1476196 RepID=UPI000BA553CB|nr:transcriptional regulator [Helicobacter sp. 11S03491-1]PAF41441.1 hypothetical protein BKH45_06885 [Helicobacter sp. 11S03491-1]